MEDHQRIGAYTLGSTLALLGAGWLVSWGVIVASAGKDSTTHFLIPITYVAVVACPVGLLIIPAIMFDWPSKLWRLVKRHSDPGQQLPDQPAGSAPPVSYPQQDTQGTTTFRGFHIGDNSELKVRSSAQTLADGGGLSGQAKFDAQHFPGHPELFVRDVGSQGEQEGARQANQGPPEEADGDAA